MTYAYGEGEPGSPISPITHPVYEPPPPPRRRLATALAALIVGLVVAAAGLGVGWLWFDRAPRMEMIRVRGGFQPAQSEPEQWITAEGYFGLLGLGIGVAITVLVWFALRRHRGLLMMIALVAGSLAGAWLSWWLASRMSVAELAPIRDAKVGDQILWPPTVALDLRNGVTSRAPMGVVWAQALAAAVTYTLLAGFSVHPNLRGPTPTPPEVPEEAGVPY